MTNTELARKLRECADGVFNSNSMYYVDVMRQAADELDRRATIQPTAATVGEIALFGGTLKEVAWAKGKMPAPGTKLYAAPVAPADAVRDAARYRLKVPGQPVCGDSDCNSCERWPEATPPAMNAASPSAIPSGIYYSKLLDNFYDMESECGKGADFHGKWYERRAEFPDEASGSGSVPVGQGSASVAINESSASAVDGQESVNLSNKQGSATSGEADALAHRIADRIVRYELRTHSAIFTVVRAALAAKAEQSNTPVPREVYEFVLMLTLESGGMISGNRLSARAKEILALLDAPVAERAAAPASVPEGYVLVPTEINDVVRLGFAYVDAARKVNPTGRWAFSHAGWRALLAEAATIAALKCSAAAAPEVAQPAAQGESIDTPEWRKLVDEHHNEAFSYQAEYRDAKEFPEWRALVAHINAWGAIQRQEGRRDMHETNVALVGENCALAEKLRAARGPLAALESYCADVYANAKLRNVETAHRRADEMAKLARSTFDSLATPAPTAGEPGARGLEPDWAGEFKSHADWVNRAQRALKSPAYAPAICVDAKGRRCTHGADMSRARDEGAFPVRYFWDFKATQGEKGGAA